MSDGLRLLRVYSDMKSNELAIILGISKSYLSEIEKGSKRVTLELLKRYAIVFDTNPSKILAFIENYDQKPESAKKTIKNGIVDYLLENKI